MIPITLAELAGAVGGEVVNAAADATVTGDAFADSRHVVPAGLFIAIRGERVDGHDFATGAVKCGAAAALVTRPVGVPAVVVDDTVAALGRLSRHVVDRLPTLQVIGITGSQGKTSTKDILAQLLEPAGETVAATGSLNTEIGVPLTALRVRSGTAYLVCEMGARGRGHIRYLTTLVAPSVGAVLNVGLAHLGEFGTRRDIAAAKQELVEALPEDGLAVLNADDPIVMGMRNGTSARTVTFGEAGGADVRIGALVTGADGQPEFELHVGGHAVDISLPLLGLHQAHNAAAAAAVATGLGIPLGDVARRLRAVRVRSRWRMEMSQTAGGVTVINDAYNANPDSVRAALITLVDVGRRRPGATRTVAVLGEMRELGEASEHEHDEIGRLAARLGVSQLVVVGDEARPIHVGAGSEGFPETASVCVPDVEAVLSFLGGALRPGDVVLVKASRAVGLELVARALKDQVAGPGSTAATEADT